MSGRRGRGLTCPVCGSDTRVGDSRPGRGIIRRRRICLKCDARTTTIEIPESEMRLLDAAMAFLKKLNAKPKEAP